MKKLRFLMYIIFLAIPFISYARLIEIVAEDGTILYVSDSETVQSFFAKCRQDRHCKAGYKELALEVEGRIIKEGSNQSLSPLSYFSSCDLNKAVVLRLQYPIPKNRFSSQHFAHTLIDIEASSGKIKKCSLYETPAYFFKKCRNSGDCQELSPMTLIFGNIEIQENSEVANNPFYSFQTNSHFAQVKRK
ncbi:hypothetical protein HYV10_00280 [Candidatus Dependentiae bacterium]|nr:hypothetical protein [Candidatus Dependentiae bacterium]